MGIGKWNPAADRIGHPPDRSTYEHGGRIADDYGQFLFGGRAYGIDWTESACSSIVGNTQYWTRMICTGRQFECALEFVYVCQSDFQLVCTRYGVGNLSDDSRNCTAAWRMVNTSTYIAEEVCDEKT